MIKETAHKPAGPGGGQFTGPGDGAGSSSGDAHQARQKKIAYALTQAARNSPHLSDAQKQDFTASVHKVVSKMPPKALDKMAANVKRVRYHPSQEKMTASILAEDAALAEKFKGKNVLIKGSYDSKTSQLDLNGAGTFNGIASSTDQFHAHEMAHSLDRNHQHSSTPEWQEVFKTEMGGDKLSKMASKTAAEAWAEFGRTVYAGDKTPEEIEKSFPKASAVWKKEGLWAS